MRKDKILPLVFLLATLQIFSASPFGAFSEIHTPRENVYLVRAAEETATTNWSHGEWTVDDLLRQREGFGRNVAGGLDGKVYYVTSLADKGSGSLREVAERPEKFWIVFNVSGTIRLESAISVKSDKTIDGRGAEIIITGYGFVMDSVSNIIVTNLQFDTAKEPDSDAIRVYQNCHDIWIHHCDFTNFSDGCVDITRGSTDITVSWCRFWDHDKIILIGADPSHTGDVNIRVTVHHNFFFGTVQRHPRARFGEVDAYNNYVYGWRSYGMGVSMYAELLVESNIFEAEEDKDAVISRVGTEEKGYVKLANNLLLNGASAEDDEPGKVFNRSTFYKATIEPADTELKQKIMALAGSRIPANPRIMTDAKRSSKEYPYKAFFEEPVMADASVNFSAVIPPFRSAAEKIVNYEWNFGDGNTASGMTTKHTYTNAGTYNVALTVTNEAGKSTKVTATVIVQKELLPMWMIGTIVAAVLILAAVYLRVRRKSS